MHAAGADPVLDMLAELQGAARDRLALAYAPKSKGALRSALRKFGHFSRAVRGRQLFMVSAVGGDRPAAVHNEWTFILFVEWMLRNVSTKTGKVVSSGTIQSYVSLLKGYMLFTYDFELPADSPRLSRVIKMIKCNDPLAGMRGKRRGFRRRHLRLLWELGGARCSSSKVATTLLAALGTSWHTLARGGELCLPTRGDLKFKVLADGTRYAILMLRPLKKRGAGLAPKVPQYIQEADGGGADVYMLLRRMVAADPIDSSVADVTPLFRLPMARGAGYRAITVAQLRKYVRDCAAAIGFIIRKQWGAHSGRIGGATDLAATGKASQLLLQAKGRWASDLGRIYARMTRRCQLAASKLMHTARGRDLEEIHPDFTQGI